MPRRRQAERNDEENPKGVVVRKMREFGYDGDFFADDLELSTTQSIGRGKPPRLNRYYHYCLWAQALMRKKVGPEAAEYSFPPSVLAFIRHLVPGNIKGEFREHAYKVSMEEFCEAMELPKL